MADDLVQRIEAKCAALDHELEADLVKLLADAADRIEALKKDVQAAAEMYRMAHAKLRERAWRPMETAPRDGTRILLCGDPKRYGKPVCTSQWLDFLDRWDGFSRDATFVGWLPLPQPPEEAK